ncbi:hypothetical protein [Salibacterium lacus]|uniref:SdpI family protein n=1 Tax=Salibacterium lacus TaxID=1898109 RepID=A0ABW5T468_9BACI
MTVPMLFIYILIGLIGSWIYYIVAKVKNEKSGVVDSGKALNYYRLSYRRRLRRSLWTLPAGIVIIAGLYFVPVMTTNVYIALAAIFIIASAIEIGYTYIKWKKTSIASE